MVRPGKLLRENPFADVSPVKVVERRHALRELTGDEIRLLLTTAWNSTTVFRGLSGVDRAMLYATACGTGFRAGGLASLTPECFNLDDLRPSLTLPVRSDKSRRGKVQPVPPDLAQGLREWLSGKPTGQPVWPGSWASDKKAAEMLRDDLATCGIPYVVEGPDGPEHADFHSLRHSYLTALGRSGVDLRVQQELAGHSSSQTTERYSHVRLDDLAGAVDRLPAMLSTVTTVESAYLLLTFAADSGGGFPIVNECETPNIPTDDGRRNPSTSKAIDSDRLPTTTPDELPPAGFGTATLGLGNRCSNP